MRTTVTLDPDVAMKLKQRMKETDHTFKRALNDCLRAGLAVPVPAKPKKKFVVDPWPGGIFPHVNIDKALQLFGELEDEACIRKMYPQKRSARKSA